MSRVRAERNNTLDGDVAYSALLDYKGGWSWINPRGVRGQSMLRELGHATALCVCLGVLASAQHFELAHTFTPADSEPGDYFGSGVALSGDLAVIRSRTPYQGVADDPPNQTHVFRQSPDGEWAEEQVIALGGAGVWAGKEVAIDAGEIIVGMSSEPNWERRSIDFFAESGGVWSPSPLTPIPELTRPIDRSSPEVLRWRLFNSSSHGGRAVDADGGYVVADAGVTPFDRNTEGGGGVLVYERMPEGGWKESFGFLNPGGELFENNLFGTSVAIAEGVMAAGTSNNTGDPLGVAIYEWQSDGAWPMTAGLPVPNSRENSLNRVFSLAASSDTVAGSTLYGDTFVYSKRSDGSWADAIDLSDVPLGPGIDEETASWSVSRDNYIASLALEDNWIAEGVITDLTSFVRLYNRDADGDWRLAQVIPSPDPTSRAFGSSLAIDAGRLLVGASGPFAPSLESGSAYLYVLVPEPVTFSLLAMAAVVGLQRRRFARR